jgi:GH35 family endo-1,4-beta-xylanase
MKLYMRCIYMSALLPESMHLHAQEDIMHHHWTHNSTRDTLATDDTLFTMLLVSMTPVSTMLVTFWCIIQAYSWNAKRHTVTPSAVITMIGSTDELHKEKPKPTAVITYTAA